MDTFTRTTRASTSSVPTLASMMALVREMEDRRKEIDASRDMAIKSLRSQGYYAAIFNDGFGELWILDDAVVDKIEASIPRSAIGETLGFIRYVRLSRSPLGPPR